MLTTTNWSVQQIDGRSDFKNMIELIAWHCGKQQPNRFTDLWLLNVLY